MHESIVAVLILHFSLIESLLLFGGNEFFKFLNTTDFHLQVLALGIAFFHIAKNVTFALCVHIEHEGSRIAVDGDILHITAIHTLLEIGISKTLRRTRRTIARENKENKSCYDNEIEPTEIETRTILLTFLLVLHLISLVVIVCCHSINLYSFLRYEEFFKKFLYSSFYILHFISPSLEYLEYLHHPTNCRCRRIVEHQEQTHAPSRLCSPKPPK